jgi:hypothetical protein
MDTTTNNPSSFFSTDPPILSIPASTLLIGLASLSSTAQHSALSIPLPMHFATIKSCWGLDKDAFLGTQRFIRPEGEPEDWAPALIPAVSLLSEALEKQVGVAFGLVL